MVLSNADNADNADKANKRLDSILVIQELARRYINVKPAKSTLIILSTFK
jgi:hypothetical protein